MARRSLRKGIQSMKALASLLENACRRGFSIEDAAGRSDSAKIEELSLSVAGQLSAHGGGRGEPVLLLIGNSALDIAGFYAIWRANMVAVPLHQTAPAEVIAQMRRTVGARFAITDGVLECSAERSPSPAA